MYVLRAKEEHVIVDLNQTYLIYVVEYRCYVISFRLLISNKHSTRGLSFQHKTGWPTNYGRVWKYIYSWKGKKKNSVMKVSRGGGGYMSIIHVGDGGPSQTLSINELSHFFIVLLDNVYCSMTSRKIWIECLLYRWR